MNDIERYAGFLRDSIEFFAGPHSNVTKKRQFGDVLLTIAAARYSRMLQTRTGDPLLTRSERRSRDLQPEI
jgi:hypothetical protein